MKNFVAITVFTLAILIGGHHATAQNSNPSLVVGWTDLAPLFKTESDGTPSGFGIKIITEIGKRAGFDISFHKLENPEAMIRAQAQGDVDLSAAVPTLPILHSTNVFSDPIAQTNIRIFLRTEDADKLDPSTMSDHPIAVPTLSLGTEGSEFIARNAPVQIPVSTRSITELLRGSVDALVASDNLTFADAHALRLDHRILAVGAPLQSFDRVVALRKELQHFLPAINTAIAELEADGMLDELRRVHKVSVSPLEPDVLKVGVYHAPPYAIVEPNGTFSGFAVDTLRQLSKSAGIAIDFTSINEEELALGPTPGRYDLLTQAPIREDARQRMDFTVPIDRTYFSVFTRIGEGAEISDLASMSGYRLGVRASGVARGLAEKQSGLTLRNYDDPEALVEGLLNGGVDAILYPRHAVVVAAAKMGVQSRIREIDTPIHSIDTAIALRFGLGQTRERLNAVIPGYLASSVNANLREKYFGTPIFWTPERVAFFRDSAILAGLSALLLFIILTGWRQKRAKDERRKFASRIVDNVPHGMILVSAEGKIEFANKFVRERTPNSEKLLARGKDFKEVIETLIDDGTLNLEGADRTETLERVAVSGMREEMVHEFKYRGGKTYLRHSIPLGDDGTLLAYTDVTKDRQRLVEFQNLNDRLVQQISLAKAANEELSAFAYATSHDLKAPTNTMSLLIEELDHTIRPTLSSCDAELLDDMSTTNQRMAQLIDDVLEYTNAISNDFDRTELDLNQTLSEVLDDLRADILTCDAEIKSEHLPSVSAPIRFKFVSFCKTL